MAPDPVPSGSATASATASAFGPAPRLRAAAVADAAALAAFAARAFRETYAPPAGVCEPADVEAYIAHAFGPDRQAAELAEPGGVTLLAECHGALVGYGQLRAGSRPDAVAGFRRALAGDAGPAPVVRLDAAGTVAWVELARLYVDRPWHGRGVAGALLAGLDRAGAALAAAGGGGAGWLWLSVYQRNPRAVAFYRRAGFRLLGTGTFRMGRDVQDDWLLVRPLAGGDG